MYAQSTRERATLNKRWLSLHVTSYDYNAAKIKAQKVTRPEHFCTLPRDNCPASVCATAVEPQASKGMACD
eukprot:2001732-Amphidinium_carterae.1